MIKLVNYAEASSGVKEFVVDTAEELESITNCEMGSTALVIDTSAIYIKNGKGEWVEFGG